MHDITDWTEADLLRLIEEGEEESTSLEYKDARSLSGDQKMEISKDVSGMANAAGGVIVYGIAESDNRPVGLSGTSDKKISREWLENVITTWTQPPVSGVQIKPIALSDRTEAFAVFVPQAVALAPHQAKDKKYYRRRNFKVEAMEHAEVLDVMRRATTPNLVGYLCFEEQGRLTDGSIDFKMSIRLENLTLEAATYSVARILIDRAALIENHGGIGEFTRSHTETIEIATGSTDLVVFSKNFIPPNAMPFFKGPKWHIGDTSVRIQPGIPYYFKIHLMCNGFDGHATGGLVLSSGHLHKIPGSTLDLCDARGEPLGDLTSDHLARFRITTE